MSYTDRNTPPSYAVVYKILDANERAWKGGNGNLVSSYDWTVGVGKIYTNMKVAANIAENISKQGHVATVTLFKLERLECPN